MHTCTYIQYIYTLYNVFGVCTVKSVFENLVLSCCGFFTNEIHRCVI